MRSSLSIRRADSFRSPGARHKPANKYKTSGNASAMMSPFNDATPVKKMRYVNAASRDMRFIYFSTVQQNSIQPTKVGGTGIVRLMDSIISLHDRYRDLSHCIGDDLARNITRHPVLGQQNDAMGQDRDGITFDIVR